MRESIEKTAERKEKLLKALEKNLGIITPSCREVGCTKKTYYDYIKADPEFKKAVEALSETALDLAEAMLLVKIKEGSERSIHFYLSRKGKSRGYGDKMDIDVSNKNINFKFNLDDVSEFEGEE